MSYLTDKWSPLYGGAISTPGACWIRNIDNVCFSVVDYQAGVYTLKDGAGNPINVSTDELGNEFRPT